MAYWDVEFIGYIFLDSNQAKSKMLKATTIGGRDGLVSWIAATIGLRPDGILSSLGFRQRVGGNSCGSAAESVIIRN